MRRIILSLVLLVVGVTAFAQESFPINGIRDVRAGMYAFTNATIIQNESVKIEKGTLLIKQGKIKENDTIVLAAFGSGFTWGSAIIKW